MDAVPGGGLRHGAGDSPDTIIGYLLIGTDNTARKLVEAEQKSSISASGPAILYPLADRIQHRRPDDHRPLGIITTQQADGGPDRLHARRADRRAFQGLLHRPARAEAGIN